MNAWIKAVLNKTYITVFILLCVIFLAPEILLSQNSEPLFKDDNFIEPQRGPVIFNHYEHELNYDCAVCHHEYDEKGNLLEGVASIDLRCSDCHSLEGEGNIPSLRRAYHVQCKNCHVQEEAGPFTCSECHIR
ncbi:MAG: acidic tetraheme cytochrome c3 TmcA [Desulfonatronovibrio sp.]